MKLSLVGDSYELSWITGILTSDLCFCLGASRGLDDRKGSNCGVDTCAKFLGWERLVGGSEGGEDLDPELDSAVRPWLKCCCKNIFIFF